MDINRFERVRSSERPAVGAPVWTGHYWAGCGYTSTYGQGDLVSDVLSVSLPWVVLRDHFNYFHFEAGSTFRVRPGHAGKYLGHVIPQVEPDLAL